MKLRDEIQHTINKYSRENNSNTPDFILANYLYACLVTFEDAVNNRSDWYGRHDAPGQAPTPAPALDAVRPYGKCPTCGHEAFSPALREAVENFIACVNASGAEAIMHGELIARYNKLKAALSGEKESHEQ